MPSVPHPIANVPGVTEAVLFVKSSCVDKLPVPWPRCQELKGGDVAVPTKDDLTIAVSHAWPYQVHPDPLGEKAAVLGELVENAIAKRKPSGNTLLFVDLFSVPQRPFLQGQLARTKEEDDKFATGLKAFPTIYLMADATVHVDLDLTEFPTDGEIYKVPLETLRDVSLMQLGPSVQVVASESRDTTPFDLLLSVNGAPVETIRDVERALAEAGGAPSTLGMLGCSCTSSDHGFAELRRAQFGKRNTLSSHVKGWIYLERFASMVKVAMTHQSQVEGLVFTNSEFIRDQIFKGGERLRAAVAQGYLKEELERFAAELSEKQFSAASIDKQTNTGGKGGLTAAEINASAYSGSDREVVWGLMQEMVDYLSTNWAAEQRSQEHRQLVLAVGRQDVEALENILSMRASPDIADQRGSTVLHEAAMGHNTEVLKVLLRYGANTLAQDEMRSIPAHKIFLKMDSDSESCFRLLAPSRKELEVRNKAGVTPLHRFFSWCLLANENEAFLPGMAVVDELRVRFPDLKVGEKDDDSDELDAVIGVTESQMKCSVGSRVVEVHVWENAAGAEHHVLWLALQTFVPTTANLLAARAVARRVAAEYPVKVHVISWEAIDETVFDKEDKEEVRAAMKESLLTVIEALPLKEKFILVDDTAADFTTILWRLQHRLAGALIMNAFTIFPADFAETEFYQKISGMFKHWGGKLRNRETGFLTANMSNMALPTSKKMMTKSLARWEEDLKNATSVFWLSMDNMCSLDPMSKTRRFHGLESLADKFPIVLGLSDQAPDFMVGESMQRLLIILGVAEMDYIPNSKGMWAYEGARQSRRVSLLIEDVIAQAFNTRRPARSGGEESAKVVAKNTTTEVDKVADKANDGGDAAKSDSTPGCCSLQ